MCVCVVVVVVVVVHVHSCVVCVLAFSIMYSSKHVYTLPVYTVSTYSAMFRK